MAAIVTGSLFVDAAALPQWLWYISLGFPASHFVCAVILEIHAVLMKKNTQPKDVSVHPAASKAVNEVINYSRYDKLDEKDEGKSKLLHLLCYFYWMGLIFYLGVMHVIVRMQLIQRREVVRRSH